MIVRRIAMLLPVALAQPATAQSPDAERECTATAPCTARDDIVVVASGARQAAERTGQAITVLDKATIDRRQLANLAELLAATPGVTYSRNGGPGQTTAVRIRGAEDAQTLVLINGVRVADPASPAGAFDFASLVAGAVDRIEVLRGANSVPWGSAALGGVINIVTATPTREPAGGVTAEYGEHHAWRLDARASAAVGPLRLSGAAGWSRDGGVSAFRLGTERDSSRQFAAIGRVEADLTSVLTLDLRGQYTDSRAGFDGFPPPSFTFADTSGFARARRYFGYAGLQLDAGSVAQRLAFTYAETQRDSFTSATAAPTPFRGRTTRIEYQADARAASWLRLVFGGEREVSRTAEGSTGVTSGYAQAVLDPVASVTLTGGLRIDAHRAYGTTTTASANASWRIGNGTILRASYAEGFKAPTLFQLSSSFGTPDLRPETAQSFDLGVEQALLGGALRFGATAFHRDTTDQINFVVFPPRADRPFGYYGNIDRTRAQGVEAFIEMRPAPTLALSANYTLTDVVDRTSGLPLLRRPRHSVSASLDWDVARALRLGMDIRTTSDSADEDFEAFPSRRLDLDGYTLATIRGAVALSRRFELFGRIENLFDERYETVLRYGSYARNAHVGLRARL